MKKLATLATLVAVAAVPATVGAANEKTFTSKLTGKAEVPAQGDLNGSGTAVIKLRGTKVCYEIKMKGIAGSTAAHIHVGAKGKAGDVLVALYGSESAARRRQGCVAATDAQRRAIAKNPKGHYVNVHNREFPAGAIRGQLAKK